MANLREDTITATATPSCYLCGNMGKPLYNNLQDRLYKAPGSWNLKQCPNPDCGLAWLDPMPTSEDIGKAYENYFTHGNPAPQLLERHRNSLLRQIYNFAKAGYLAQRFGYPTAHFSWQKSIGLLFYLLPPRRACLDRNVMGLPAQPGGRLLDVGCGNGSFLALMRSLHWQVEGVEVDPKAVEQARAQGLEVRPGTLAAQQYPDNHFDVVTMSHVIEHVHDPVGLLQECLRILKSGGRLVVITPNLQSWGHRIYKQAWRGLEPPRHLYVYTIPALRTLTKRAGFTVRSLITIASGAHFIYKASRAIAKNGTYIVASVAPPGERLMAMSFFWLEWALLKLHPNLGEELVLIGEK